MKLLPPVTSFKKHLNTFIPLKSGSSFLTYEIIYIIIILIVKIQCALVVWKIIHLYIISYTILAIFFSSLYSTENVSFLNISHTLIYGSNVFNSVCNKLIIEQSILYIENPGGIMHIRYKKLEAFW